MFALLQKLIPKHLISRMIGKIAASENALIKAILIRAFKKTYNVSLLNAERKKVKEYRSFNDFFTRKIELETNQKPPEESLIYSPAEGSVSQLGKIEEGRLLQAKGQSYSLTELSQIDPQPFLNGSFLTIYLSPSNYHRVHLPVSAMLQQTISIPGSLYSVNSVTEKSISDLFCKNERLVCQFLTDSGPILVILVGAMIVASIQTTWDGPPSPYTQKEKNNHQLNFSSCAEIGRFFLGSTVICCFPPKTFVLDDHLKVGSKLDVCSPIGTKI